MLDLLVTHATLPDGRTDMSLAVQDGRFVEIAAGLQVPAHETLDAGGLLVSPPFVDAHFHLDATLSYGIPRINESGTLLEGIALWGELKPQLTHEALVERALAYCDWAVSRGLLAIRSHVDTSDPRLVTVEAMLDVQKRVAPYLDLQLVAFPQDGVLRTQGGLDSLTRALDMGVGIVGGIPHFERTMAQGAESVRLLCELAAERGLPVDMHCDETDDPLSRHIETLAAETQRLGLQGRVVGSHCTSMHSMDNYYVSKLLPLIAESGVSVIANPLINITLQGRHDSYPKRRGMTRVPELMAHGVRVAFGQDCCMDPWYSLGSGDMLDVAHMGLHVAQMTSQAAMRRCFEAVTTAPAAIMGLAGHGLEVGRNADFVLLQAGDPVEALRLRATRLQVRRRGKLLASSPAARATLALPGRPANVECRQHPSVSADRPGAA
ncbi:amidohydrolase family protein [Xylophilus rhododendri]|uniref:Amidohydrolase family protein n=1 Tax=Xylophilus rhododendri TaxID=2697032 RepID=A0A857IZT5_9BURK|nr:amidohydrolase family protein [Xylophilus rhododendri]QHI97120.1 amidohydrolase family protein [Xylophilus rhododendri]